jgi:glutathione peroxidase
MAAKISIKGKEAAPLYQWLTQKALNGSMDANVSWNFNKFLLDENGHLIGHFSTRVSPLDEEILNKIR